MGSGSDRYWVALPGRGKAVELTRAELLDRKARGDLPAGTLVAKFGEKAWVPLDRLDEVLAKVEPGDDAVRESIEAPPPSSAAQGVDAFEAPPEIAPTLAGAIDAPAEIAEPQPAPKPSAPPEPDDKPAGKPRTLIFALGAALVALLVSSAVFYAWFRYGYARGAVLEHVPTDCSKLEYIDFDAIDGAAPMRGLLARRDKALSDWAEDLDDEDGYRRSQDDDAKGRASVLRWLKKKNIRPYGDVKEIATCELRDGDETTVLTVVGGTFRGRDLLGALREALIRRDRKAKEDRLALEEVDGRPVLKLDEDRAIVMATGQIALIGKRKVLTRFLKGKPTAKSYGIRDGDFLVKRWTTADGNGIAIEERWEIRGDRLLFVRTWAKGPSDEVKVLKARFADAASAIRKVDGLDPIADAWENADVHLQGDEGRVELTWPIKDVTKAAKTVVDADRREMRAIVAALRNVPGRDFFQHLVQPGVDVFDLKLSPWF